MALARLQLVEELITASLSVCILGNRLRWRFACRRFDENSLRSNIWKEREKQNWVEGEAGYDTVTTKASANLTESSGAGMVFQNCLKKRSLGLCTLT